MQNWPKIGTVGFQELADPLRDAVDHLYELQRKPPCDVPWDGYGFSDELSGSCEQPDKRLSAQSVEYEEYDQGRDPMRVIIGLAIQFGIEQGVRSEKARRESQDSVWDLCADIHAIGTALEAKGDG